MSQHAQLALVELSFLRPALQRLLDLLGELLRVSFHRLGKRMPGGPGMYGRFLELDPQALFFRIRLGILLRLHGLCVCHPSLDDVFGQRQEMAAQGPPIHRIAKDQVRLSLALGDRTATSSDTTAIGRLGIAGDVGFHLLGDQFGGAEFYPNLVPANEKLNNPLFLSLETFWKKVAESGKTISVELQLGYTSNDLRPDFIRVDFVIDSLPFPFRFKNEAPSPALLKFVKDTLDKSGLVPPP